MRINKFGKGKHRVCCDLWQDDKTGKYYKWIRGKWVNVTKAVDETDEILGYIFDDEEWQKHKRKYE